MKFVLSFPIRCLIAAGSITACQTSFAQILLTQNFTNSTASNQPVSSIGWNAYRGASATDYTSTTPSANDRIGISNLAGNPSSTVGYLFTVNQVTASEIWAGVDTFAAITPGVITWKMGNSGTGITVRLLVENGGNWYATNSTFSNSSAYSTAASFSGSTAADVSKSFSFDPSAGLWRSFTLNPGSSMSLGAVTGTNLPSSSITGIGFFVQHASTLNQTARLDTLVINAIPEPSSCALFLGALALYLGRRGVRSNIFPG